MYTHLPTLFNTAKIITWSLFLLMTVPTTYVIINDTSIIMEWCLMSEKCTPIFFMLLADKIGLLFSCVVLFISSNVLTFSNMYMKDDKFNNRFTLLVLLFILSMNMLIFIPHLMMLLLGWDGLGLVSFILVMYYQNNSSLAAAMLTALTNRIGDVAILIAIALTLNQGHWLIINMWSSHYMIQQTMLITCAAMTKSAQMPFSSWLPAAMAAPTPVSALVHSSTLVTAGVFLTIRFYSFLHLINHFNLFMLIISTSTTLMAGLSANTECDFKKIVALSTLSQLGIMMFSIAINMPWLAFFHMTTHALFKALLFICVGSMIHFHSHSQDLRWMGNLFNQMPTISSCMMISNLALCGFPFLAGFYSKDMIMEFMMYSPTNMIIMSLSLLSLGLTSMYSMRATIVTNLSNNMSLPYTSISENKMITTPALMLSIAATVMGSIVAWIYPIYGNIMMIPLLYKMLPLILMLLGAYTSSYMLLFTNKLMLTQYNLYASSTMWFLSPLSTQSLMKSSSKYTHMMLKSIDQGWMENMSAQGMNKMILTSTHTMMKYMPQNPNTYLMLMMSSLSMLLLINHL